MDRGLSCSVAIIWFAVGLFPLYPSVILTGSMEPDIMPGDVVLVAKWIVTLLRSDIIVFDNGRKYILPQGHRYP